MLHECAIYYILTGFNFDKDTGVPYF